jgi:hypothetical protein
MEHLGSGPQWNMAVRKNADICKENLWKNLFYIQNFFPFEQMVSIPYNTMLSVIKNLAISNFIIYY